MIQKAILGLSLVILPLFGIFAQTTIEKMNIANEEFNKGVIQGLEGQYTDALDHFTKAIELNPLYAEAYLYGGLAHSELGNHNDAIRYFTISIELDSKYSDQAYYFRGMARAALNDYPGAIHDFSQAIMVNPDHVSFFQRGKANYTLGQYGRALQDFEIALRMKPGFSQGILYRAKAYYRTGLLSEALDDFNIAISKSPDSPEAYYYRGLVYRDLGNEAAAKENFDKVAQISPSMAIEKEITPEVQFDTEPEETGTNYSSGPGKTISPPHSNSGTHAQENAPVYDPGQLSPGYYDHNFTLAAINDGYGVQVASYTAGDHLVRLANAYRERYQQPVFIQVSQVNDRKLYKIIIGGMGKRQQAEVLRDDLREDEFPDCFIVNFDQIR